MRPTLQDGFDVTGLSVIGIGGLAVALAQPHDFEIRDANRDHQRISPELSRLGDVLGGGLGGVTIAVAQLYFDNENGRAHTEALIDSFLVTSLLKTTNQRLRPGSDNRQSMPSGHTSTSFTTATSLSYAYGWKAAVPSYMLAIFVGATRLADDMHWFSDTLAGAAIGFFWGRATWFHHGRLIPSVNHESASLQWAFDF